MTDRQSLTMVHDPLGAHVQDPYPLYAMARRIEVDPFFHLRGARALPVEW